MKYILCRTRSQGKILYNYCMISIVIPYFNRKVLLLKTLQSISETAYKDIEVIIVDDASDPEHQLNDIVTNYWFPIRLFVIKPEQRWWGKDPAVLCNLGFAASKSDIIILQNPECAYAGDILTDAANNCNGNMAISYACYSLDEVDTQTYTKKSSIEYFNQYVEEKQIRGRSCWFNHCSFRPRGYVFCFAMTSHNWKIVGGVDTEYKDGIGFSDLDLLDRIWYAKIKICIPDPSRPHVLHLYHPHTENSEFWEQMGRNKKVYDKKKMERDRYCWLLKELGI
jgi:glycosyltransferase involved in cell wall biosynthesis